MNTHHKSHRLILPLKHKCRICSGNKHQLLGRKEGRDVYLCSVCSVIWVDLNLSYDEYLLTYSPKYWFEHQYMRGGLDIRQRANHDYEIAKERMDKVSNWISNGHLIDIGSSNGAFVRRAIEMGFSAEGLEIDPYIAKLSEELHGVKMQVGNFSTKEFQSEFYDVVVLNDVFEHFYNPLEDIKKIHRILKPNGLLVIETPDATAFQQVGYDLNWKHIRPLEHIFVFSKNLLTEILKPFLGLVYTECPIEDKVSIYACKHSYQC